MPVIANWSILYRGRMYGKGDVIAQPDPKMVVAWEASGAASVVEKMSEKTALALELTEAEQEAAPDDKTAGSAKRTTAQGAPGKRAGSSGAEGEMIGRPPKKK